MRFAKETDDEYQWLFSELHKCHWVPIPTGTFDQETDDSKRGAICILHNHHQVLMIYVYICMGGCYSCRLKRE